MEAGVVRRHRRHQAEPAQQLRPGDDADEQAVAAEPFPLARGEHRGDDDGAGMDRPALERVVEVLAVRGGAVDERRAERIEPAGVAERRAPARRPSIDGRKRGAT